MCSSYLHNAIMEQPPFLRVKHSEKAHRHRQQLCGLKPGEVELEVLFAYLNEAIVEQLPHCAAYRLGSRSSGRQAWGLKCASAAL